MDHKIRFIAKDSKAGGINLTFIESLKDLLPTCFINKSGEFKVGIKRCDCHRLNFSVK